MTLYVERLGSGPDLVLLHGWGMNGAVFDGIKTELSKQFRLHIIDLPGFGYSADLGIENLDLSSWLDLMLKKELQRVIDWNAVDKADYLSAMERSVVKDIEIKHLLKNALTEKINDRELYMKGIDVSYYYEGYSEYRVEDL